MLIIGSKPRSHYKLGKLEVVVFTLSRGHSVTLAHVDGTYDSAVSGNYVIFTALWANRARNQIVAVHCFSLLVNLVLPLCSHNIHRA